MAKKFADSEKVRTFAPEEDINELEKGSGSTPGFFSFSLSENAGNVGTSGYVGTSGNAGYAGTTKKNK